MLLYDLFILAQLLIRSSDNEEKYIIYNMKSHIVELTNISPSIIIRRAMERFDPLSNY
jgi:hypothetical protein